MRNRCRKKTVSEKEGSRIMALSEEPILSRLDRVDNMLGQLEEGRGRSAKSWSNASTPSSEGVASCFDFSPKQMEKQCLPINRVMLDTEIKGTLVQRIDLVEQRLLRLEGEVKNEKKRQVTEETNEKSSRKKKGLKGLISCMV